MGELGVLTDAMGDEGDDPMPLKKKEEPMPEANRMRR
jgi:hypothetical protein